MRIWLVCFGVLFAIAELYQWLKHLMLPLPIYILGGAFLAIASNFNKLSSLPWRDSVSEPSSDTPAVQPPNLSQSSSTAQSTRSISFTIRKPEHFDQPE